MVPLRSLTMGVVLKLLAILIGLGLVYVSVKRWLLAARPPPPPRPVERQDVPPADDLVRCPRCGTWGIAGQPCASPDCVRFRAQ